MEKPKRPGGLTFFAIINFVVAFISIAAACLTFFSLLFIDQVPLESLSEAQRTGIEALKNMPTGSFIFMISKSAIGGILLILAGIGYLKQNKILGYITGNIYIAAMVIYTVLSQYILGTAGKTGVVSYIISLLYPAVTLVILNFIYRKNFNE